MKYFTVVSYRSLEVGYFETFKETKRLLKTLSAGGEVP